MKYLCILIFLSISSSLFANDCSDIDLRIEALGEPRSQGDIGWCFAYAAADLITYKIGKKVSAAELGTTYFKFRNGKAVKLWEDQSFEEGGLVAAAMKVAIKNDVCLEEDMPSEKFLVLSSVDNLPNETLPNVSSAINILELIKNKSQTNVYIQFPNTRKDDLLEYLSNHTIRETWEKVVSNACDRKKISISNLKVKAPFWARLSTKKNFSIIDRELENENVLGVTYRAAFLTDIHAKGNTLHASVIIGRRWNTKSRTCEYLIRNSWGTRCDQYDRTITCDAGHVWIPRPLLQKNIRYVDYLKK